jgi:hypothetical protein
LIGTSLLAAVTIGITPTNANWLAFEFSAAMSDPPPSRTWGLTVTFLAEEALLHSQVHRRGVGGRQRADRDRGRRRPVTAARRGRAWMLSPPVR